MGIDKIPSNDNNFKMASKKFTEAEPQKTIFVRNLPYSANNSTLEDAFSEYGPIKQAFVVKDKDNQSKCRGFGYVQFVLQEDASKATKSQVALEGRKLAVTYANKKKKHEGREMKQKGKKGNEDEMTEEKDKEGDEGKDEETTAPVEETKKKKKKKEKELEETGFK